MKSSCGRTSVSVIPVPGLSQMVPTVRSKRSETDEKGDHSEPGSMGANEKDRRSDKQRSYRSRRGTTLLPARTSPKPDGRVRVSRMPPVWKSLNWLFEQIRICLTQRRIIVLFRMFCLGCAGKIFDIKFVYSNVCMQRMSQFAKLNSFVKPSTH